MHGARREDGEGGKRVDQARGEAGAAVPHRAREGAHGEDRQDEDRGVAETRSPLVRSEEGHSARDRPVGERRFRPVRRVVELGDEPVSRLEHLAGRLGVASLRRFVETAGALEGEREDRREGDENEDVSALRPHGSPAFPFR